MKNLTPIPLTAEKFAPYGDVVDMETATNTLSMNYDVATRYYDLARIDTRDNEGETCISLVRSKAISLPFQIKVMEYHPLGSQLFFPLQSKPFLILVAPAAKKLDLEKMELFISNGLQGVNYHKNTWHHYLMPLAETGNFIVVDRKGYGDNCVETELDTVVVIEEE